MKKITILTVAFLTTILVVSCNQNKKQQTAEPAQSAEESHESEGVLKLNNGDLWMANVETTEGIQRMSRLVANFTDTENIEAYPELKAKFEAEFGAIISKCTMTGEAHDQLHNYLLPMKPLFKDLTAEDLATRKSALEKMAKHLSEYSAYFK
jgi:cell division protein ZapA (FtsZ GTPase activity inhibitor)